MDKLPVTSKEVSEALFALYVVLVDYGVSDDAITLHFEPSEISISIKWPIDDESIMTVEVVSKFTKEQSDATVARYKIAWEDIFNRYSQGGMPIADIELIRDRWDGITRFEHILSVIANETKSDPNDILLVPIVERTCDHRVLVHIDRQDEEGWYGYPLEKPEQIGWWMKTDWRVSCGSDVCMCHPVATA